MSIFANVACLPCFSHLGISVGYVLFSYLKVVPVYLRLLLMMGEKYSYCGCKGNYSIQIQLEITLV